MKTSVRSLMVLSVFAMALTGLALGQETHYRVVADVPFDFYAGNQHLDAGTYLIAVNYGDHAVTLQNQKTGHSSVLLAMPGDGIGSGGAEVQFDLIGGSYALADVKTRSTGARFHERETRLASAQPATAVTIAAMLR
jgi:hypothetical protein